MTLTFLLDYQQVSRTDKSIVVAGSVNYLRAKFSPKSDDWKPPVTALFNGTAVLLDENWECAVPWEVVKSAGQFTVSAFCGSLQTANTVAVPVMASGYKNGETPPEPTPDVYNQILGVMQDAKDAAETAQEAVGIAQDAAEHAPTIIGGVWHKWDAEAGEYKSTGTQAQGPEGKQGPKGDKGDKGDRGDKGDTGATGAQGPTGPTGETGPVGPQGEKGDTGGQGPQGVPGTAATITIGSVTESAPGGDASVTNSGTATAAVLDFVIPRGETGPTGATGATGPAGLGVPQPTADDAGKIPVVNAEGSGYELGNPAPEVDDTLSIPGSPADAAATGEAIEAVLPDDESVGAKPWSSKQIIDTLCPPLEVTGNPVVCYPVAGYPLGVTASWEPRQEGTGDPSPENVRPIVGLDSVQVTRCGKNLLPPQTPQTKSGVTLTVQEDGGLHLSGTCTAAEGYPITFSVLMGVTLNGQYTFSMWNTAAIGSHLQMRLQESETAQVSSAATNFSAAVVNATNTFTLDNQYVYGWLIRIGGGETYDVTLYPQLEAGDTATPYEPYQPGTTATLTLPETIYGGELDAVTGVGSEEVHGMQLNGTEGWIQTVGDGLGLSYFECTFPDSTDLLPSSGGSIALARQSQKISHFKIGNPYSENVDDAGWVYNTASVDSASARIRASRFENVEGWKSYLAAQAAAGTPVTIAYKLATPTPFQATGNQSLPALHGTNTIYTDADSVTVTGRADPVQTINALTGRIAALEDAATGG